MIVTVEKKCGRCGKVEKQNMELEEAQALEERDTAMDAAEDSLEELLNDTLDDNHPDIIVAVRDEDGNYKVKSLRGLCVTKNAKKNRGCAHRVADLLQEVFQVKKSKKKPKVEPDTEGDTEGDTE